MIPAQTTEYIEDTLECTPRELELVVLEGKKAEGSLFLRAQTGRRISAFLYSTHYRMQPQAGFAKGDEIHVSYYFDATGLSVGTCVKGQLVVVSNLHQLQIPFSVTVSDSYEDEKLGSIRNLFHFTNLAATDWNSAMDLFYSERMEKLFSGHDARLMPLYKGMSAVKDNGRNLDEFLISLNKKQRAQFSLEEDVLLLPQVYEPQQQILTIKRKGWGYTSLRVCLEGEYLTADKQVLTQDDFEDQVCHFSFYLLPTDGYEHREKIRLIPDGGSEELCCELVRIGKQKKDNPKLLEQKEKRRQTALLVRAYLDHSTGRGNPGEALSRAEKCIEKINQTDGRNIEGRLYQTHLLCSMGRFQEAGWIFSHVERVIENEVVTPAQQAYFWYLEAMLARGNGGDYMRLQSSAVRRMRDLLANQRGDAIITSLYLRMLPREQITPVKALSLYEECYYSGCESPILLREAFRVIEDNPAYLSGLGRFEISLLQFALRYELLTAGIEGRVIELVKREKQAGRALLAFLRRMYEGYQSDDLLQAVCGLLIRSVRTDKESFFWFQKAVDKQLRITMLYESYMASRGMDDLSLPPKYVLMYFAYQCDLEKRLKAHLFRIILEHHTRLGALIDAYDPQIREFAKKMLPTGECNADLACCYRFLFRDKKEVEAAADYLLPLAFLHEAVVSDPEAKKVIVLEAGLEREKSFPVTDGQAMVEIVSEDVCLLLEDEKGNRRQAIGAIKTTRLLPLDVVRNYILASDYTSSELALLRLSGSGDDFLKKTEEWPLYMEAARDPRIALPLRLSVLERLLSVLYDRDETETMKELLGEYPVEGADEKKRGRIITYHIMLEQDEMALSLLWEYGFEGVPPKSLNRLILRGLDNIPEADPRWLALMYYTYRQGKYTPQLLEYLCRFYEGGIQQMVQIFQDAISLEVDALDLAERILTAAVYTHGYLPQWDRVYEYYDTHGGSSEKKKRFLQDVSFKSFVGGEILTADMMSFLEKEFLMEEQMPSLCRIVWLYEMSQNQDAFTDRQERLIDMLVKQQLSESGYLPFFERFKYLFPELLPYTARTWLVYRSKPGRRVTVSYLGGLPGEESYQMRTLEELCPGYYAKDFCLFYGENIHYYIQEENFADTVLTQSGQLEWDEARKREASGRFEILYDMQMSRGLGDEKSARALAMEYRRQDALTEQLFS